MKDSFIEDMPSHIENWLRQKPFRELSAMQQQEVLFYFSADGYDNMYALLQESSYYLSKDIPGLQPDENLRRKLHTLTAAHKGGSFTDAVSVIAQGLTRLLRAPMPAYQVVTAFGLLLLTVFFFSGRKTAGPESAERVFVHDTLYIESAGNGNETLAVADSHNILLQHAGVQPSHGMNKAKLKSGNIDQMDTDAIMRGEMPSAPSNKDTELSKHSNGGTEHINVLDDTSTQQLMHPRL